MPSILALDLGTRCGHAFGGPNEIPVSGSIRLKEPRESQGAAFALFMGWLDDTIRVLRPDVIAIERPFHLGAFAARGNSEAAVLVSYGLNAIAQGLAHRWGIKVVAEYAQTIRKHFIGKAKAGTREATKAAVLARAKLLQFLPADCIDDNRADAVATWGWAVSTLLRARPAALHLFGEEALVG